MLSDGSDLMQVGNAFQALAAATEKVRSPSVERLDRRYLQRDGVIRPRVSSNFAKEADRISPFIVKAVSTHHTVVQWRSGQSIARSWVQFPASISATHSSATVSKRAG